jgi:hypothetical protein
MRRKEKMNKNNRQAILDKRRQLLESLKDGEISLREYLYESERLLYGLPQKELPKTRYNNKSALAEIIAKVIRAVCSPINALAPGTLGNRLIPNNLVLSDRVFTSHWEVVYHKLEKFSGLLHGLRDKDGYIAEDKLNNALLENKIVSQGFLGKIKAALIKDEVYFENGGSCYWLERAINKKGIYSYGHAIDYGI